MISADRHVKGDLTRRRICLSRQVGHRAWCQVPCSRSRGLAPVVSFVAHFEAIHKKYVWWIYM